jgi:hypothetical protein
VTVARAISLPQSIHPCRLHPSVQPSGEVGGAGGHGPDATKAGKSGTGAISGIAAIA